MKNHCLATLLLASLSTATVAQMPTPGPEHQKLAAYAGTWDAAIEMTGEDGKPVASKGVTVLKAGPGGFWLIDDFEAQMMGMPFTGHGMTGYDPAKGKYVSTWIDSWSTAAMVLEGSYDKAGKVLTMSGLAAGPDGKPVMHKLVTTDKDANTRVFEMFVPGPGGADVKVLTITYTRRAAKGDSKK